MPRRNLILILAAAAISVACYQRADRNPLGRYFAEVADHIEGQYIDRVDRKALWSGAVQGMIGALKDPHSGYIEAQAAADLNEELDQHFGGIGIQVAVDIPSNRLTVISPIAGSPAYRAGILAGDVIAKIDGKSTAALNRLEAINLMRGPIGAPVQLTVERAGHDKPIELPPILREQIHVDSVMGDTRNADDTWNFLVSSDPKIGYVRIVGFGERTVDELKAALKQLTAEHAHALVLDLRNNPGGVLSAAVEVCDLFLPAGQRIVGVRSRDKLVAHDFDAGSGEKFFVGAPIVVLVNGGSASASEIVAACLQDEHRAVVIGQRTFGKGTVQNMIPLHGQQGILKLTTADYIRPNGHNIHRRVDAKPSDEWGVSPDPNFEVKLDETEARNWMKWRADRDIVRPRNGSTSPDPDDPSLNDAVLRRALEYLKSQLNESPKQPS